MSKKQETIRIIYILTKLELGGAQKICLSLLKQIPKRGFSTSLVSGDGGILLDQAHAHSDVLLLSSFKREIGLSTIWYELVTFFQLMIYLRSQKKRYPSIIVHTHSTKAGILGRWAAFFARIPVRVHTVHGFGFHDHQFFLIRWMIIIVEWCTSFITSHFICVSHKDRNCGIELFPYFAKKSSVIRASVDDQNFFVPAVAVNVSSGDVPIVFGSVACFKPQKNIFDLLRAFSLVHKNSSRSVELQIIGDGQMREQIENFIDVHDLGSQVQLLGWQNDVAPIMHTWHAYVSTALWEGLPCAIVEARLSHLPVVAYDVGGIAEVVKDGYNGYLHQAGDHKKIAQSMLDLTRDMSLRDSLSSYKDNLEEFTQLSMIEKHSKLYHSL